VLDVDFAQFTDPGNLRSHNEDYLGYAAPEPSKKSRNRSWLFALADGVGGQDRGEVASQAAVDHLLTGFRQATVADPLTSLLPRLVQAANTHVFETAAAVGPGRSSMATTIVACALRFDRAVVCHAGDSRCYLIRHGQARALTRDHTVTSEQIRLGLLTAREASTSGSRNLLSRSLGNDMFVTVETNEHTVHKNDVLLLCSDGLHVSVKELDIVRTLDRAANLQAASKELVAIAKERDGRDNISVQLIRIRSVERVGMYRGQPYRLP
jgi:serine/threonine protein phosphatase PrpC